ncbi:MAG: hypothetical protein P8Z49_09620, partial [Acidobacteriota bacterium]
DLLFERFLSEERGEWPDIDLDLPSGDQRERVIQYVFEKYGDLDTFIDRKIADCSFSRAVENWKSVYGASQVLVLFFDNLEADPWQYYVRICEFLEIVPDTNIRSTVADRVNKGSEEPIPEKYIVRITDGWRNDIRELSHLVADIPQSWLD